MASPTHPPSTLALTPYLVGDPAKGAAAVSWSGVARGGGETGAGGVGRSCRRCRSEERGGERPPYISSRDNLPRQVELVIDHRRVSCSSASRRGGEVLASRRRGTGGPPPPAAEKKEEKGSPRELETAAGSSIPSRKLHRGHATHPHHPAAPTTGLGARSPTAPHTHTHRVREKRSERALM